MAVRDQLRHQQFETVVWPHATAAYNLARWICCNESNSADIVQELVRAMQYLETYRDNDLRS